MTHERTREQRLRRAASRQGLILAKSRRRDPRALDFGQYMLVDAVTDTVVAYALTSLDQVELELTRD